MPPEASCSHPEPRDARCGRHEVPPLRMSDLRIDMDSEQGGAQTEGAFRALCRMQVTFKRKKGEYFACYEFGNALTPDSDQMIRIGSRGGVEGRKPSRLKSAGAAGLPAQRQCSTECQRAHRV